MNGTKNFLTSKTLWGALLVLLASVSNLLGITPEQLPSADEIVAIFGGVLTIIGRFTATKALTVSQ